MLAPLNNINRHNFWFYNVLLKVKIKMNIINKCSHCFFMLTNGTCQVLLNNNNESVNI